MIQLRKGYMHNGTKFNIGQKVTLIPELENELIKKKIAVRSTWKGKVEKIKTNFFKPKD